MTSDEATRRRGDEGGRPRRPGAGSSRPGMTLIEVLIALAIILALTGSMYGFLYELLDTRTQTTGIALRQEAASQLLERLERDLLCAVASGPGVRGDETRITVLTRGVPVFAASEPASTALADLEQAEYRFRNALVETRRTVVGVDAAGGDFESLGAEVHDVRFRYHDGEDWRDTFDTRRAGRLPAAVEVSVWFEGEDEEDDPFADEVIPGMPEDFEMPDLEELAADDDPVVAAALEELGPPPDRRRVIVVPDAEGNVDGDEIELFIDEVGEGVP